jgi:hypothetical protein
VRCLQFVHPRVNLPVPLRSGGCPVFGFSPANCHPDPTISRSALHPWVHPFLTPLPGFSASVSVPRTHLTDPPVVSGCICLSIFCLAPVFLHPPLGFSLSEPFSSFFLHVLDSVLLHLQSVRLVR